MTAGARFWLRSAAGGFTFPLGLELLKKAKVEAGILERKWERSRPAISNLSIPKVSESEGIFLPLEASSKSVWSPGKD